MYELYYLLSFYAIVLVIVAAFAIFIECQQSLYRNS